MEKILLSSSPDWGISRAVLAWIWGRFAPQNGQGRMASRGLIGNYLLKPHPQVCALSTIPLLQSMLEQWQIGATAHICPPPADIANDQEVKRCYVQLKNQYF